MPARVFRIKPLEVKLLANLRRFRNRDKGAASFSEISAPAFPPGAPLLRRRGLRGGAAGGGGGVRLARRGGGAERGGRGSEGSGRLGYILGPPGEFR